MRVEVYETEGEALDAAAEHVAGVLRGSPAPRPVVAVPGGRSGRALMTALAARDDLPWETVRWCIARERVPPGAGEERGGELLRREIGTPRRLPADAVVVPGEDPDADAAAVAAEYEARLAEHLGPDGVLDVVCVAVAADGAPADRGRAAASPAPRPLVVADGGDVALAPGTIDAARTVVTIATGAAAARAVTRLLQEGDSASVPQVLPSERVAWFADRAAVAELLRTAEPADA